MSTLNFVCDILLKNLDRLRIFYENWLCETHKMLYCLVNSVNSAKEFLKGKIFYLEDYCFEKRHGFIFNGNITHGNLVTDFMESVSHATAYHAVWCRNLRVLIKESQKLGYSFQGFVDIGSGKGKACFYAYLKQIFPSIIGVEFSGPLIEIAEKNKRKIGALSITFIHEDASSFILPNQSNLVFMFNPFDVIVLEKFIVNNLAHFWSNDSLIAYANDAERECLIKFGFETVFRDQIRKISLYKFKKSP